MSHQSLNSRKRVSNNHSDVDDGPPQPASYTGVVGDENNNIKGIMKNKKSSSSSPFSSVTKVMVVSALMIVLFGLSMKISKDTRMMTMEELSGLPLSGHPVVSVISSSERSNNDSRTLENQQQKKKSAVAVLQPKLRIAKTTAITNDDGSIVPVLLKDDGSLWKRPTQWKLLQLMERVGRYPQYLKDLTVQPYKDSKDELCIAAGTTVSKLVANHDVLFFTNNKENEPFMKELRNDYDVPKKVRHITGFEVFSAMGKNHSHSFHAHGESWLGQVEGRRMWWFVAPTEPQPKRVNACKYITKEEPVPSNAMSFIQNPGDIIWFPKDWYHATCALDDWTVGIGWQQGQTIRQQFPPLQDQEQNIKNNDLDSYLTECLKTPIQLKQTAKETKQSNTEPPHDKEWKWFDGDLNAYYNTLTTEENNKRDPNEISSYAVHRWLGDPKNTEEHYKLLLAAAEKHLSSPSSSKVQKMPLRVVDAGCGLGAGLMWMEQNAPEWTLTGYTISEEQHKYITQTLPEHKFNAKLQSFNELSEEEPLDVIYSIEALIHSENIAQTLQEWANHLEPGGIIALIDDFLAPGVDPSGQDIQDFSKSWLANSLVTVEGLQSIVSKMGLELVEDKDLVEEYKIIQRNYRNQKPAIQPFGGRTHQGWMGSKWRQRLTVEGKLKYDLVVFQKKSTTTVASQSVMTDDSMGSCAAVPTVSGDSTTNDYPSILPQLMSGQGKDGGQPMECISGWYCCNKGLEWFELMSRDRTERKIDFLQLDQKLFGNYMEVFARHLNSFYGGSRYPTDPPSSGRFLDIGGTGSTSSGMKQVTSKFQNFAGPLEYWKLDSDPAAKALERTVYCDIDQCPEAETCSFDVTFSHTVLEHAKRPWLAFDTIARITKKGGLTMHLVPWSYQYHATPEDNFRFSHTALVTLLEDRGFETLEVGYDICTKQENKKKSIDEHYDIIWLTYVVARKK
jgi:2-polyprenyl-3-methyl-5-hydroxy-6-metoxy-1,4-benzoquinol methylase